MTRTKTKIIKLTEEQKNTVQRLKTEWEKHYHGALLELRNSHNETIDDIKIRIQNEKQKYVAIGNMTMKELRVSGHNLTMYDNVPLLSSTQNSNRECSISNVPKSIMKSNLKKSKNCSSDEESHRATSLDRSRKKSPGRTTKGRMSRSLSRSRLPKHVTIQTPPEETNFTTPEKRMPIPGTYGFVTPKVKPNIPLTVLRRPKQGEMAISMQGSPLLVTGVITEKCANVSIPLQDGRVISLLPGKSRDLRVSAIPEIPDSTRQQLLNLRDHLNKVCQLEN